MHCLAVIRFARTPARTFRNVELDKFARSRPMLQPGRVASARRASAASRNVLRARRAAVVTPRRSRPTARWSTRDARRGQAGRRAPRRSRATDHRQRDDAPLRARGGDPRGSSRPGPRARRSGHRAAPGRGTSHRRRPRRSRVLTATRSPRSRSARSASANGRLEVRLRQPRGVHADATHGLER